MMATWCGPLWLGVTYALAAAGVEPIATHFYLCAWAGLIVTFNQLIARGEGSSLLARVGDAGWVQIGFWSAVSWFFYELCNFRLQNWYYILVEDEPLLRWLATFVAFGTVFPGIFWIDHWLRTRWSSSVRIPPLQLSSNHRRVLVAGGVGFFVLWVADPAHFYPLVWGGTFLILASLNHRLGIDGILRQLERGDLGPTLRLLIAGFIAGGCWEFFNFWARAKWIYTVPLFDELKLFEMPLLGFVGFPPFAVECACTYRLLVWARLCPPLGDFTQQGPPRSKIFRTVIPLLALLFSHGVYDHMQRVTVTSTTPRVQQIRAFTQSDLKWFRQQGVEHLTDLVGLGSERVWRQLEQDVEAVTVARVRDTVELYMHEGIGHQFGNQLVAAGYHSLRDLEASDAATVSERLSKSAGEGPAPRPSQVKVWFHRLGR